MNAGINAVDHVPVPNFQEFSRGGENEVGDYENCSISES